MVTIAGKSGLVEDVTLRYVQLRDYEGNVHFVPNGEITVVTSSSRTFAFAVFDVTIALEQAVEPVIEVMTSIAAQMRAHPVLGPKILDDLDIAGIETWTPGGITLRARMKVQALEQANVRREFLLRLKQAFDNHRIQQPRNTVMMIDKESAPSARQAARGAAGTAVRPATKKGGAARRGPALVQPPSVSRDRALRRRPRAARAAFALPALLFETLIETARAPPRRAVLRATRDRRPPGLRSPRFRVV